jgi:hypothetical protein
MSLKTVQGSAKGKAKDRSLLIAEMCDGGPAGRGAIKDGMGLRGTSGLLDVLRPIGKTGRIIRVGMIKIDVKYFELIDARYFRSPIFIRVID